MQRDTANFIQHEYGEDGLEKDRLSRRDVIETGKDWKLWYALVFNICGSVPTQAFSVFLPLVLKGLGYSSIEANLVRQILQCSLQIRTCLLTESDDGSSICVRGCWPVPLCVQL
jgi:hypothetical protein